MGVSGRGRLTAAELRAQMTASVELGAGFMDRLFPGWGEEVDTALLNMAHYQCCVLGQVRGRHPEVEARDAGDVQAAWYNGAWVYDTARKLGYTQEDPARALGFLVPPTRSPRLAGARYALLDDLWREQIERRRHDSSDDRRTVDSAGEASREGGS
jgi:hypothetical protein